jgi:hypothetical protein
MARYLILAVLSFCGLIEPANAACQRPTPPYCVTLYSKIDDPVLANSCTREMEDYQRDMDAFTECQREDARRAEDDYNAAVDNYDRRTGLRWQSR